MSDIARSAEIRAPQALVFDSLCKAASLREWLCDRAFTQPHSKGRYWMRWDDGTRVEGEYVQVREPDSMAFTWRASELPGQTTVRISLKRVNELVQVDLAHTGLGAGPNWAEGVDHLDQLWDAGLENLKSVLETGIDLRHAHRPYLGVQWALAEGLGIQVLRVIGGYGAEDGDLVPGDVILALGGRPISDYRTMVDALEACEAGQRVKLEILRGDEQLTAQVMLGAIARSEKLLGPRNIIAGVRNRQLRLQRLLSDTLRGITEQEASRRPAPDAWSVKEIIAHLSVSERLLHHRLYQIVMRSWDDTPAGNAAMLPEALAATMARSDHLSRLLDRLAQDQAETLAFLASLRPEILANKARHRRLAEAVDTSEHMHEHIAQITDVLAAIRHKPSAQSAPSVASLPAAAELAMPLDAEPAGAEAQDASA